MAVCSFVFVCCVWFIVLLLCFLVSERLLCCGGGLFRVNSAVFVVIFVCSLFWIVLGELNLMFGLDNALLDCCLLVCLFCRWLSGFAVVYVFVVALVGLV